MPGRLLRRAPYDITREPGQKRARSAQEAGLLAPENPLLSVREIGSGSISYAAQQQLPPQCERARRACAEVPREALAESMEAMRRPGRSTA